MKRILLLIASAALLLPALVQCSKEYDDSWIKSKFDQIDSKLSNLESNVNSLNSYKTIVDNLQKGKVVDRITDNGDGSFSIYYVGESTPVVIKTIKGDKGEPGDPGTPGNDGKDGKDGVTPEFKIEDGDWFVSYDQGATWTKLGSASSSESLFFQNVYVEGDFLVLVLIDGTEVRINLRNEPAPVLEDWLGDWKYDDFNVSITKAGDARVTLNWYDESNAAYVQIPLDFDAETGNMTLSMPNNRAVGGNYDDATGTGLSYYLNLYGADGKRLSPDPAEGTQIATFSLKADKTEAVAAPADANFYYFFARPYDWTNRKWGSSVFYMYCTDESKLEKVGGGGGETSSVPTKADWEGDWNKEGVSTPATLTFYEASGYFMCYAPLSNYNDVGFVFTFNEEDGTWSFVTQRNDGYIAYRTGEDGASEYLYFYAQHDSEYLSIQKGDTVLKGTMSEDKQTITITSGIENCNKVPLYNNTAKKWFTQPGNWLGTYTRAK